MTAMDRRTLKLPFTIGREPDWICPECDKGVLKIDQSTFKFEERAGSKRARSHDEWEPDFVKHVYTCLLHCMNGKCGEVIASSGIGEVDWDVREGENGISEEHYENYFTPVLFEPPLRIIKIPKSCPEDVSEPLVESFRLLFASPSAAANSIRVAMEELLTHLKIKRFSKSGGKRRFITLHERIELLPRKYSELRELILAIKWLGNAGSHGSGSITFDDVLDAYDLTAHILEEIYAPKRRKLKAMAKKVNKKKGPTR